MTSVRQLGWLDANLFIHPLFEHDPHGPRCEEILRSLERGEAEAWVHAVTVHELTYALQKARTDTIRHPRDVLQYLARVLALRSVHIPDKEAVLEALHRWATDGGRFADALLLALARSSGLPVCTVNVHHFHGVRNTYIEPDPGRPVP